MLDDPRDYEKVEEYSDDAILSIQLLEQQLKKYQRGFNILMRYFDYIPDDLKSKIDKKLKEINL